jgi:hypothetical protein
LCGRLREANEREDGTDNDHKADNVNNRIHIFSPWNENQLFADERLAPITKPASNASVPTVATKAVVATG